MIIRLTLISLFILVSATLLSAQSDHFDNTGKLYAVVAVVSITLVGIVLFLIYLERKIKILEKMINDEYRRT